MITATPFVYGRTRTVDYRWLQKPVIPLRIGFFADALESCSSNLRKGQREYFVALDDGGCVLAVLLSLRGAEDQRGRTISFVLGYTVDSGVARDFAYYLPALLESCDRTIFGYFDAVTQCVDSDGQVSIAPFNLISLGIHGSGNLRPTFDSLNLFTGDRFGNGWQGVGSNPSDDLCQPISTTQVPQVQITDTWLNKTAATIRSSVNTPRMVSSFDIGGLGAIFDGSEEALKAFGTANMTHGLISHPGWEKKGVPEDAAPLEQMRRFVGKSDSQVPNPISHEATKAYGSGSFDEHSLSGGKRGPKTQPPAPEKHGLFDLLFGKSGRSGGSSEK